MKLPLCFTRHEGKRTLCHLLLVADMIGIEAFLAVEFIMMIANIQTLGVPVIYSSLPGVISAALSGVLMPVLGLVTENVATTKCSKALVLMLVNIIQIIGGLMVFFANILQLFYVSTPETAQNPTTRPPLLPLEENQTSVLDIDALSSWRHAESSIERGYTNHQSISVNSTLTSALVMPAVKDIDTSSFSMTSVPVLAIIGYALIDAGYDISNCFLKTFAMAVTSPDDHSDVIVKSIFVGAFGGCVITLIGSLGIGERLTAGTTYDVNATECAFLAGVSTLMLLSSMLVSMVVGLVYKMDVGQDVRAVEVLSRSRSAKCPVGIRSTKTPREQPTIEERSRLLSDSSRSSDITKESLEQAWSFSQSSTHTILEHSGLLTHRERDVSGVQATSPLASTVPITPRQTGLRGFVLRNGSRFFLCLATFFSCGAHYTFNMYSVNFVGVAVFHGDPSSPVDSPEYANYRAGMQAASVGFILLYAFFVLVASSQNYVLRHYGWWSETAIGALVFIGANFMCAFSKTSLGYYVTVTMNGLFRALVFTVPYILLDKVIKHQMAKGYSMKGTRSLDIVMIAAMWPCAFALCSGVMGPLLDWTGDVTTPIFYTIITALLGLAMFWPLRKI